MKKHKRPESKPVLILRDRPYQGRDNYEAAVEAIQERLATMPVGLYRCEIQHDSWCSIFKGGRCNCNPEVELREFVDPRDGKLN